MGVEDSGGGVFSSSPIFIGGLDRTGKTLMRLMLSAHSKIAITRRTYLWPKYNNKFGDLKQPENLNRCLVEILDSKTIANFELDGDRIRELFLKGNATYPRLFAIILMQFADSQGKTRWGEQMGMIEQYADLIISAYPDAKIIHMIRDPRDRYTEKFADQNSKPGKVGWETERWLKSISLADRNLQRYPDNYLVLRYESFTSQPEETMRKVCDFIGEYYEQNMLTMENTIRFGSKPIQFNEQRLNNEADGTGTSKIDRGVLSKRELSYFQSSTINELQKHNYNIEELRLSVPERIVYILYDWPINYAGGMAYKYSSSNIGNN